MIPVKFPESNTTFGPPSDLDESQCARIPAYLGEVKRGSIEGAHIVVVAWMPNEEDIRRLCTGSPVFLSMIGGLAPHMMGTDFKTVTTPP